MEFFNIDPRIFKVIVGNELTTTSKPDPEGINLAINLLGYEGDKQNIVYVGDSFNDCLAGLNAGTSIYLCNRGDIQESEYPMIHSLMELFK